MNYEGVGISWPKSDACPQKTHLGLKRKETLTRNWSNEYHISDHIVDNGCVEFPEFLSLMAQKMELFNLDEEAIYTECFRVSGGFYF